MDTTDSRIDRRSALRLVGAASVAALAGCSSGSSDGGDGTEARSFGGWMEGVGNYDGVVDETGSSTVTVEVGVEANGGPYGFAPPAVKVSAGTTVEWRWTGRGRHDVVAKDGSYQSEPSSEEGHTFTHTFEAAGTSKYYCRPHRAMGMRGVVVVE